MQTFDISFKHHRFPPQIVAHAVWLYLRFNPGLREGEEMLLERGIDQHGFGPKPIITDKLRSYGAAKADLAQGLDHWSQKGLNTLAENSYLPFRKRERTMQGHRPPGPLERFVLMHSTTRNCFSVSSRRRAAQTIRYHRLEAFDAWKIASCVA